jgi:uncharacterized protein (DUF302 family)
MSNSLGTIEGLISIQSSLGPKEAMDRLENEIRANGMDVLARIDHAAGAAKAALTLPPTEVIVFGNAHGGTPLMQSVRTIWIDLPLKHSFGRTHRAKHGCRITNRAGLCSGAKSGKRSVCGSRVLDQTR